MPEPHGSVAREGQRRRRLRYRVRSGVLAVAVVGVWLGVLLDPMIGPVALLALAGLGLTLAVVLAAMGLGGLGFGLFALGDRLVGWVRRASNWPEG